MTLIAFLKHMLFAAALAGLSAVIVRTMIAIGVMDRPNARKAHDRPTPKSGGVGIVVTFLVGVFLLYRFAAFSRLADPYFRGVILASTAIALVALVDDLRDWPFTVKLAAQIGAALVAVGSGLYVGVYNLPVVGPVDLGLVGAAATVAWILFATNAMNFIDGLDGLAGGTSLVAAGFLAAIAAGQGGWFVYFASVLLAAGLVGFLPFNWPRARIFMGDVGSQFCGFVLAMLGVAAARFERVELSFLIVPMLLAGVLFDVLFTLIRRALAGERLTEAHRGHLYQVAQRSGVPTRAIAIVHWGFAALGGIVCLWFVSAPPDVKPLLPPLLLLPQAAWVAFVASRARAARIGRW